MGSNPTASAKTNRTALAVLFVLINRKSGGIRKGVVASRRGDQNSPVDYFARAAKVCSHSTKKRVRRRAADAVRTYPPLPPKQTGRLSARRDKEVFCINFAAPKMKTPASGLMKK